MDESAGVDDRLMAEAEEMAKELGVIVAQLRFYTAPVTKPVMCNTCVHRQDYKMDGTGCAAYPDGIPPDLMRRGEHDTPYPDDHGIRYEPMAGTCIAAQRRNDAHSER